MRNIFGRLIPLLLAAALWLLPPASAFSAVTFKQAIAQWGGTPPVASLSFTTTAASDSILVASFGASGLPTTFSGSGGAYTSGFQANGSASSVAAGSALSVSAGAQTATVNSGAGFMTGVAGLDYSGVGSINVTGTYNNTPGTGSGAAVGALVNVPVGSVLVAICIELTNLSVSETITSPSGTTRASNISNIAYLAVDYAGAGSNITPTFTVPDGATNEYFVVQWLLTPAIAASSGPNPLFRLGALPFAPLAWAIRRRQIRARERKAAVPDDGAERDRPLLAHLRAEFSAA
jgi:hypothetical protein